MLTLRPDVTERPATAIRPPCRNAFATPRPFHRMSSLDEKRVHGANTDAATLFVACDLGVARITVAGERVGKIELVHRCVARDLAISETSLAVATGDDVLVRTDETIEETGFGPATAVGITDGLLAGGPEGTVARREGDGWSELGTVESVNAIDGDLLGTDGGVYRLSGDELCYSGLENVRDVAVVDTPYAATATGLYYLGNGWMGALDGEFEMVAADTADRAHAATAERCYEYDGKWTPIDGIGESVVGVSYTDGMYAVTADGTLLTETEDGWRTHPLGLGETHAIVARPADRKPV